MGNWLEPRMRIPLVGIIAITVIVGIVALFLRAQLTENDVRIQPPALEETNVRGSASFQGQRQFSLTYKERLAGMLHSDRGAIAFTVDVPARLLTVKQDGREEEVLLQPTEDGTGLHATFERSGRDVTTVVYPGKRTLRYADGFPVDVTLSDAVSYEGGFLYDGERHAFRYLPSEDKAVIENGERWSVALDGTLEGTWRDTHTVSVDPEKQTATISGLW